MLPERQAIMSGKGLRILLAALLCVMLVPAAALMRPQEAQALTSAQYEFEKETFVSVKGTLALASDKTLWDIKDPDNPVKLLDSAKEYEQGSYCKAAITEDGSLYIWNENATCLVPNVDPSDYVKHTAPTKIMSSVSHVSVSGDCMLAVVKTDGTLWTWGSNSNYQLGTDAVEKGATDTTPRKILDDVSTVVMAYGHGTAIKTDGTLWSWGAYSGDGSDNGSGFNECVATPTRILDNVKEVALRDSGGCALKNDGTLLSWGGNAYGALGDGTYGIYGDGSITCARSPKAIMTNVATLVNSGAVIKKDGTLWAWGVNNYCQVGVEKDSAASITTTDKYSVVASPVQILSNVKSASCGSSHCGAVQNDGTLWMWGGNSSGEIGNGSYNTQGKPVKIMEGISYLSANGAYTTAIDEKGKLFVWGIGKGAGNAYEVSPQKVMGGVAQVSLGENHSGAVKTDGTLWMWGSNTYGELGCGTTEMTSVPIKVMDGVKKAAAGGTLSTETVEDKNYRGNFTAALKSDGTLWMWGASAFCGIGSSATEGTCESTKILTDVVDVVCGDIATMAIKSDGTLWIWGVCYPGNGEDCQLVTKPQKVMDGVAGAAVGEYTYAAVTTSGDLYTWGSNADNMLGNGVAINWRDGYESTRGALTPAKVLSNVKQVSFGQRAAMAVTNSGNLYAWGTASMNGFSSGLSATPTQYKTGIASIVSGAFESYVIDKAGTLSAWGYGGRGSLGNGSTSDADTDNPATIMGNVSSAAASTGYDSVGTYAAAVKTDSTLWMWGDNLYGQLGLGTYGGYDASNQPYPRRVGFTQAGIGTCTVALSQTSYTYDGKEKRPTVTVKDGATSLLENVDYVVTAYNDNVNVGTASVTVRGLGLYTGETEAAFTITQQASGGGSTGGGTTGGGTTGGGSAGGYVPSVPDASEHTSEFVQVAGEWHYYDENGDDTGSVPAGFVERENATYYLKADDNTFAESEWVEDNGFSYYFNDDGEMQTGWLTLDDTTYYLGNDGKMATGWQEVDGAQYYFGEDGANDPAAVYTAPTTDKPQTVTPASPTAPAAPAAPAAQASSKKTSLAKAKVTVASTKTYTGKAIKPAVKVKLSTTTLKKNRDYTVTYKNNKNVGTATVTIKGKGSYTGTKKVTFKIVPKGTTVKSLVGTAYSRSLKGPGIGVTLKKQAKQTTGYQVRWSTSKSMKGATSWLLKGTSKVKFATKLNIAKNKKYYVQVRTYKKMGSKTYYSAWSPAKAVITKK